MVVCGAGPAGLTLAWKAASKGLKVLVFDRKSSTQDIAYTTSGSFIDLGVWGLPQDVAHPISKVIFSSDKTSIVGAGKACVIRRRKLLDALENRCASSGAEVRYSVSAVEVNVSGEALDSVKLSDGSEVKATVYADCSGLGGVFNRVLPVYEGKVVQAVGFEYVLPLKSQDDTAELYVGGELAGGYGWLFPLGDGTAIVGAGTLIRDKFPEVRQMLELMLKLPRFMERVEPKPIESHAGVFRTGKPLKRFSRGNLILVGDIALQGNPAAGEGVRFVMDAAAMAAYAVAEAVEKNNIKFLAEYGRVWSLKYRQMFWVNYLAQKALVWLTQHSWALEHVMRLGAKADTNTMITLIKGEADAKFLLRKLPKIIYKIF